MKANKLDRKDLMVGDWLYSLIDRYDHTEKKLVKVTGIRTDCDIALIQCNDTDVWFFPGTYEPIPLTKEILEKNGFKKCDGCNQWSFYKYKDGDYTKQSLYYILWSDDEPYLEISSYVNGFGEFNRMGVQFVHELQHALRLCGISKEIEL